MFDKKSDYALNKQDRDAIVCKSVMGVAIRLTYADFSSEEEFQWWKAWSDQDYYNTEKTGRSYYDYTLPLEEQFVQGLLFLDELSDTSCTAEQNPTRTALALRIRNNLTEKQFRRLCLYYLEGRSELEIAKLEGVGQRRISTSLTLGRKKLVKIFEKSGWNRG